MKKASLLPALIVGSMGIAFAAISMFPDTAQFPQRPAGAGTIAGVFDSFFNSDGTAKNTAKLDGLAASGYLQDNDCANPVNKVWIGVDENGKGRCGSVNSSLLGYISDFSGSTVELWNGVAWNPISDVGGTIKVGDFIRTGNDSLVTVIFSDSSVLRLNTGSKVDFELGTNTDGDTIAQLILRHGEIWGRVMTATGINFGNNDWIAGVRGTALTMYYKNIGTESSPNWTGSINIIDSTNTIAATVSSTIDPAITTTLQAGNKIAIKEPESLVSFTQDIVTGDEGFSNVASVISSIEDSSTKTTVVRKTSLMSPWVRENIKKDLVHLANLSNSGTLSPTIKTKAKQEFFTSVPNNADECNNTLFGKVPKNNKSGKLELRSKRAKFVSVESSLNATDSCSSILTTIASSTASETEKINTTACALASMKFFGGSDPEAYCEQKGLVAVAEYTQSGSLSATLGMYTPSGVNLFKQQAELDFQIFAGMPTKYVPWILTASNNIFKDGNDGGLPPALTRLGFLSAEGLFYQSGSLEHSIFTIPALNNLQGVYINNRGTPTYVKYTLPNNINKIEISVRGASLIRNTASKHYLFGIDDGYELHVYRDGSFNKLKLDGFGKHIELTIPTVLMGLGQADKFYTVVFKKDPGSDGSLSILDENGEIVSGSNIVTGDVGTSDPFLKGDDSYIYIGTDGESNNAINDIIDSVRLYNE